MEPIEITEITEQLQVGSDQLPVVDEKNVDAVIGQGEDDRPFTIDDESLDEYYMKLSPEEIEDEVELMKVASTKELFELIASDCRKYVSIIEHYKNENLQTLFNVAIRRIEGHLLIKFKLNANDRWVEVGFFDDDNTDKETLDELKKMIAYYLKNYDDIGKQRRSHIASQFELDGPPVTTVKEKKQALPDNYFDPNENPELKINERQKESAGYAPVPEHLKGVLNQLKSDHSFDLADYEKKHSKSESEPTIDQTLSEFKKNVKAQLKPLNYHLPSDLDCAQLPKPFSQPSVSQRLTMLERLVDKGTSGEKNAFSDMKRGMESQQYLLEVLRRSGDLLQEALPEQQAYVYQFLSEVIDGQKPLAVVMLLLELTRRIRAVGQLTENQRQIIRKYDLDVMDLFSE
jgi:hypothetical protein